MSHRAIGLLLALGWAAGGCGGGGDQPDTRVATGAPRSPAERDLEHLGREVFELVDRAVDYRGSHRGRPAGSLRQMGIDSLTPTTARFVVNVEREPVITVRYRKVEGREITACRGDSHILEEAALNGGRFTLMCTNRAGVQRPIQVGSAGAP